MKTINEFSEDYSRIITSKEKSAGNESVGSMWIETKSFPKETPVKDVIEWGSDADGKLIITIDEGSITTDRPAKDFPI